jgi:hypothetical protein
VTFALEALSAAITARAETWAQLGVVWHTRSIDPNHGKPVVISEFEAATWLGDILVWITGEAELETVRLRDDRTINKHYDLTDLADLEALLDELVALLMDDRIPADAVNAPGPGTPVCGPPTQS